MVCGGVGVGQGATCRRDRSSTVDRAVGHRPVVAGLGGGRVDRDHGAAQAGPQRGVGCGAVDVRGPAGPRPRRLPGRAGGAARRRPAAARVLSSRPAARAARVTGSRVRSVGQSRQVHLREVGDRASSGSDLGGGHPHRRRRCLSGTSCPAGATPSARTRCAGSRWRATPARPTPAHACSTGRRTAPGRPGRRRVQVTVSTSVTKRGQQRARGRCRPPAAAAATRLLTSAESAPASCRSGSSSASNSSADSVGSVGVDAANAAHSSSDIGSGGTVQERPLSRTGRGSESTAPVRSICNSIASIERMFEV